MHILPIFVSLTSCIKSNKSKLSVSLFLNFIKTFPQTIAKEFLYIIHFVSEYVKIINVWELSICCTAALICGRARQGAAH